MSPKCPKCGKELRRAFGGVYTGSDPSVCPILPPYWRCDDCKIGSYNLKTWYNRRGIIKIVKEPRRWRLWRCVCGSDAHRSVEAREEIGWLDLKGFKAKIWAPLPHHKTTGHTHIVVLCAHDELCHLAGVTKRNLRVRGLQSTSSIRT